MNGKSAFGISVILGVLSLVLLVANVALINSNRHLQDSANQRQAEIGKGSSLNQLNQALIQALAEAAVTTNDTAAKDLLAAQGITINMNPNGSATTKQAPAAAADPATKSAPPVITKKK